MSSKQDIIEILKELKSIEKPIFTMKLDSIGIYEFDYCLFTNEGIYPCGYCGCLYGPLSMTQLECDTVKRLQNYDFIDIEELYELCEEGKITEQEMDDLVEKYNSLDLGERYSTIEILTALQCVPDKEYFLVEVLQALPGDLKVKVYDTRQEIRDGFYSVATSILGMNNFERWDDMEENDIIEWYNYLKANPEENWDTWENKDINFCELE